jgi:hypothetical protein
MEMIGLLQVALTCSFVLVSLVFGIKILTEAYISWVEFKTGLKIVLQEQLRDEEDIDG